MEIGERCVQTPTHLHIPPRTDGMRAPHRADSVGVLQRLGGNTLNLTEEEEQ